MLNKRRMRVRPFGHSYVLASPRVRAFHDQFEIAKELA